MIKGVNFTDTGTALIVLRPDGYSDILGKAVIATIDGSEKGSYTLYSVGHAYANGTIRDKGAAFFHTNSTGKLAIANNVVVILRTGRQSGKWFDCRLGMEVKNTADI